MQNTRNSLLQRAGAGVGDAWNELDSLYRPFVYEWFRLQGVASTEIDDLSQEVMKTLFEELPTFQHPGRSGAFRGWLRSICLNRLLGYRRNSKTRAHAVGGTDFQILLQGLPDADALAAAWDHEHYQALLRYLFKLVEHQFESMTLAIFRRLMLDERTVEQVTLEFGIHPGKVYVARSRVLRRLREEAERLLGEPLNETPTSR